MFYFSLKLGIFTLHRSALAESELEYNNQHVSTSVYVRVPVLHRPSSLQELIGKAADCEHLSVCMSSCVTPTFISTGTYR